MCRFFIPKEQLDPVTLEQAYVFIAKYRPDQHLLGWCRRYRRPVTYYTGRCSGYTPKDNKPFSKPLTVYLGR